MDAPGEFSIFVIQYRSPHIPRPLHFVWYTDIDADNTDRLLTYKNGKIFTTSYLSQIKELLQKQEYNLSIPEGERWMNDFETTDLFQPMVYDLSAVTASIKTNDMRLNTIEHLANFINLYEDFVYQDQANAGLKKYSDDVLIKEVWRYYYDFIFWPRFNNKKEFDEWERPSLEIDTVQLLKNLEEMMKAFENEIKSPAGE